MRVTAEQYEARRENRITGAYTIKAPNACCRRAKKLLSCAVCGRDITGPHCENCGRETEYLFPGFIVPSQASLKFRIGDRVRFSEKGKRVARGVKGERFGTVCGFFGEEFVVIREDGSPSGATYGIEFWEPIRTPRLSPDKAKVLWSAFQGDEAMVCAVCRPPSNWEIEEILNHARRE